MEQKRKRKRALHAFFPGRKPAICDRLVGRKKPQSDGLVATFALLKPFCQVGASPQKDTIAAAATRAVTKKGETRSAARLALSDPARSEQFAAASSPASATSTSGHQADAVSLSGHDPAPLSGPAPSSRVVIASRARARFRSRHRVVASRTCTRRSSVIRLGLQSSSPCARRFSRHRRLTSRLSTITSGACATSCSRHGLRPSRPSAVGSYRAGRAGLRPREKQLKPPTTPTALSE
jgi:hypothetical protein